MRIALLALGLLCCLIGGEILLVDKVVLHGGSSSVDEFSDEFAVNENDDSAAPSGRVIDLPDSGGYVLVAVGVACLVFHVAMGRSKER